MKARKATERKKSNKKSSSLNPSITIFFETSPFPVSFPPLPFPLPRRRYARALRERNTTYSLLPWCRGARSRRARAGSGGVGGERGDFFLLSLSGLTRELSPLSLLAAAIAPPLPAAALAPFYVPLALIERLRDTLPRASANAKGAARICARRWECEKLKQRRRRTFFFFFFDASSRSTFVRLFQSSSLTHTGAEPPHQPTNHAGHHLDRR